MVVTLPEALHSTILHNHQVSHPIVIERSNRHKAFRESQILIKYRHQSASEFHKSQFPGYLTKTFLVKISIPQRLVHFSKMVHAHLSPACKIGNIA